MIKKILVLIALPLAVSSCAQPISEETADEFARLAASTASLVGTPAEVQIAALSEAHENDRLCRFLRGIDTPLGDPAPRIRASELAGMQATAGAALQSYVTALIDASRGGSIQELAQAQGTLSGELQATVAATSVDADIGPALDAAFQLALAAGESQRQTRIREIMFEAIGPLFDLQFLLERDLQQVIDETSAAVSEWHRQARCVLAQSRTRAGAAEVYRTFDERSRILNAQLEAIEGAPAAVERLYVAHLLAIRDPNNFETALQDVVFVLESLNSIRAAL